MNVRQGFADRLEKLLQHFSAHLLGWEGVAVQMMNDYPRWLPDELRLVAKRTDIVPQKLENFYLKSYRLFREKRIDEQKHSPKEKVHGADFIKEIEGQAYERPKQPKSDWVDATQYTQQKGTSEDELAAELNRMHSQMDRESLEKIFRARGAFNENAFNTTGRSGGMGGGFGGGAKQTPPDQNKFMDDLLKRARETGARTSFETKKPWGSAPGYLHAYLETLEMKWPVSREDAKKQYRAMAMKTHPDRNGGNADAFKKVQSAWERVEEYFEKAK